MGFSSFVHAWVSAFGSYMIPTLAAAGLVGLVIYLFRRLSAPAPQRGGFEPPDSLVLAPWFALGAGLGLTLVLWGVEQQRAQRDTRRHLDEVILRLEGAIQARVTSYDNLLENARHLLELGRTSNSVWEGAVGALRLDEKYPGVYGIGYVAFVQEDHRNHFLNRAQEDDDTFKITPPGQRLDYFIIKNVEPDLRNEDLVGFDLGSDLNIRLVAERARDMGASSLSGRVSLPGDPGRVHFIDFLPVYDKNKPATSTEERQAALAGWVFAHFREQDFLKNLAPEILTLVNLRVYDGVEISPDTLFYDSRGSMLPPLEKGGVDDVVRSWPVAGRNWTLSITATPAFEEKYGSAKPTWAAMISLLFSLMGFGMVWGFVYARRRAAILARELTKDLLQRQAALATGSGGILITAAGGDYPILYVNPRFEKITGYAASEVLGKNGRFLQGTDRDQKGCKELRAALREQRECRVLLRNYKKDGTPFWNELTITPVRNETGKVVQFVGVQQDMTEREQLERRLSTQVSVIRALAESVTVQEASARILQALCEGQEWELGVFWRLDARAAVLRFFEMWHHPEVDVSEFEAFSRDTTYPKDMGLPGMVWSRRDPVWLPDLAKEASVPETSIVLKQGLLSACGFPVASREGLQGVLAFYSRKIWPLSKNLLLLMVGTSTQFSQYLERQESEEHEEDLAILQKGLAEFMGEGLFAMDREGYCILANTAAGRLLGYSVKTLVGQKLHDVLHPPERVKGCIPESCPILFSFQSPQPAYLDDHQVFWKHDQNPLPVAYTTSPIITEGLIQGVVLTFNDAAKRRHQEDELLRTIHEQNEKLQEAQRAMEDDKTKSMSPKSDALLQKIRDILKSSGQL